MEFISKDISPNTYVNVMDQYRPCGTAHDDRYINRRLLPKEYAAALETADKAGLTRLDQRQGARLCFSF
jgi:putative pyruvate formate lyase activating enzyme